MKSSTLETGKSMIIISLFMVLGHGNRHCAKIGITIGKVVDGTGCQSSLNFCIWYTSQLVFYFTFFHLVICLFIYLFIYFWPCCVFVAVRTGFL